MCEETNVIYIWMGWGSANILNEEYENVSGFSLWINNKMRTDMVHYHWDDFPIRPHSK